MQSIIIRADEAQGSGPHLESLHEHVSASSVAEAVPLVLHVLHCHVAVPVRHVGLVGRPALPGAAGVHVGAVLGHSVGAALLVVAVTAPQDLGVRALVMREVQTVHPAESLARVALRHLEASPLLLER